MAKRKTNEEFVLEVFDLVRNEYEFLEEYTGAKTKIKCKHNKCNHIWGVTPSNFLSGKRCPECAKTKIGDANRLTLEQIKNFIEVESNSGCKLLSKKYINNNTRMLFECKCGRKFKTEFKEFKSNNKRQCNKCGEENRTRSQTKTNEEFIKEVRRLVNDEYEFLEEYKGALKHIRCRHNICDHEWDIAPSDFLFGTRCPKCMRPNYYKDTDQFKKEIFNLVGDEYNLLSEYQGALTYVRMIHSTCGYAYKVTPSSFLSGSRCPRCNESKGEKALAKYLDHYKIKYKKEYTFDNCRYKQQLPFDFAIINNRDVFLIEYDGSQHYRGWMGRKDSLLKIQQRDNIKNQYCKDNNIPLLRIPYWEFDNIEKILEEWLQKYDLIHKKQEAI